MTARAFLVRGLLAGLIAGLAAFAVAFVVGEPPVRDAIALEEAGGAGHTHDAGAEPAETQVPRVLQSTLGLLTGTVVAGTTLGGLLGVLSALALGRFGGLGARGSTLSVTAVGFVAVAVMPYLGYPPNPPGVGSGETIGFRTALYFCLLAISIIAAVTAVLVGRRLATSWGGWYATLAAVGGYLVVMLAVMVLMPSYNEVPSDFPATLLWEFRTASFLTQLVLWAVLGVVLAELVQRLLASARPAPGALTDVRG